MGQAFCNTTGAARPLTFVLWFGGQSDYHKTMKSKLTATEAARNLSDLLNRVRYRGERFTIVRGGEEVAALVAAPVAPPPRPALVALLIDTRVLVDLERARSPALLQEIEDQGVFISAISASELLHGVERAADDARRARRQAFVERVLDIVPILPFDLDVARVHARTC